MANTHVFGSGGPEAGLASQDMRWDSWLVVMAHRRRSLAGLRGMISHTGTETRSRLPTGGSSGNIAQWRKPDAAMPRV